MTACRCPNCKVYRKRIRSTKHMWYSYFNCQLCELIYHYRFFSKKIGKYQVRVYSDSFEIYSNCNGNSWEDEVDISTSLSIQKLMNISEKDIEMMITFS
jgi:hypothetical protein